MSAPWTRLKCPSCGAALPEDALVCPECGHETRLRVSEQCPACGARMSAGEAQCPICHAQRLDVAAARGPNPLAMIAGLLTVGAFVAALWLARPWADLAQAIPGLVPTGTPTTQAALVAEAGPTPTSTPSRTPTATLPLPSLTPTNTPPPTETPTPTPTPRPPSYTVQAGDTPLGIARRFGVSLAELLAANGLSERAILSIGQELKIPEGGQAEEVEQPEEAEATPTPAAEPVIHRVASGEHLGVIAAQYGVSMQAIADANNMSVSAILRVGQELVIPVGGHTAAEASAEEGESEQEPTEEATPTSTPTPEPPGAIVDEQGTVTHIVAAGDVLGTIARRYGVSADDIARANNIRLTTILRVGQELVIPGAQYTPTPPPTPTVEVTPTHTPTPTATPTLAPLLPFTYRQPVLLAPVNGAVVRGADAKVMLNWTSVGILADREWYQLRIWRYEGDADPLVVWTKATSYRVPQELHASETGPAELIWQVTVMSRSAEADVGVAISPPSERYRFTWQ